MADKYLANVSGVTTEKEAKNSSAGAGDANKIVALNASGLIDPSMLPAGEQKSLPASENIAAGDLVNVWDDSGTAKIRKADASGGMAKRADGFVLAAITSGNSGIVYFEGVLSGLSSLTLGARYYLSGSTPGAVTATAPSGSGHLKQFVGKAISATEIAFEAEDGIVLA